MSTTLLDLATTSMPTTDMITALSSLLNEMCARNDVAQSVSGQPLRLTKFHSVCAPDISIRDYLTRTRRYSCCSDTCFIVALIYMDFAQRRSGLVVDSLNVHRLLITSIMTASKYLDDKCQRNSVYAQIGGLAVHELNQLEIELLNCVGFFLDVAPSQYKLYESALAARFVSENSTTISIPTSSPILIPGAPVTATTTITSSSTLTHKTASTLSVPSLAQAQLTSPIPSDASSSSDCLSMDYDSRSEQSSPSSSIASPAEWRSLRDVEAPMSQAVSVSH